jgi:hypothetical protein
MGASASTNFAPLQSALFAFLYVASRTGWSFDELFSA